MTCRELTEFLDRYLDGDLTEQERDEFERHLAVCDHCVRFIDGYRQAVALSRALGKTNPAPKTAPEELVQAILAARKRS